MGAKNMGAELRRLREIAAASQWDLGSRVGLTANEVSLIELGRKPLDDELLERCKVALVEITAERHQAISAAATKAASPAR